MKVGRELDALIAEKVMGWGYIDGLTYRDEKGNMVHFYPSTDIRDAWLVVEKMIDKDWQYEMQGWGKDYCHHFTFITWVPTERGSKQIIRHEEAETAPLAICLSAIKACGVEVE